MGLDSRHRCPVWTPLFLHRTLLREHVAANARRVVEQARETAGGATPKILDAGCGHMPYRDLFESCGPVTYHGADIPWAGVKLDATIIPETGRIDVPDDSYDAIVHFQTLEHVPDPRMFLSECLRVLKPGGRLFCTVPFAYHYHPVPNDYRRWTAEGLAKDLELIGFVKAEAGAVESDFVSWVTITSLYIADIFGYFFTKPLFLGMNLLGWLLRNSRRYNLTLTVYATANKP